MVRTALRRHGRSRPRADPDLRVEGGDLLAPRLVASARRGSRTPSRLSGARARRAVRRRGGRAPAARGHGWLPDLDAIPATTWERSAICWVNYPHNPTGAVAPLAFYEEPPPRAREHGFLLASDEAYSELCFDESPRSAVQVDDRTTSSSSRRCQALVDDRLPLRLHRGDARIDALRVPSERRDRAAGVRPARVRRGVVGRGARGGARERTRASATCCCRRSRRRAGSSWRATRRCISGSRCRAESRGGRSRAAARARRRRGARLVLRAERRGVRPARARPDAGECGGGGDLEELVTTKRRSRRSTAARCASPSRVDGDWRRQRGGEGGDPPLLPPAQDGDDRGRAVRVPRQDPAQDGLAAHGVRVVPPATVRYGAFLAPRRHPDAGLREHRRVRRAGHDGRHVGDRRLVRADRRGRAPLRRRRHRRRARAAGARRSSSRTARSSARAASSSRACVSASEAVLGAERRRSRRRRRSSTSPAPSPSSTAAASRRARSSCPACARRSSPPARTSSAARSSSASGASRPT